MWAIEQAGVLSVNSVALEFDTVSFGYSHDMVLSAFSARIERGDMAAVVGPNGSGKSTIVKLAVGLLSPQSGQVQIFGRPLNQFAARNSLGYVPQLALKDRSFPVTVEEVVAMGRVAAKGIGRSLDKEDRDAVVRAMAAMRISDLSGRLIGDLSGGQQQRTLVARALACEPELLIMDEPTVGIDASSKQELYSLLREMNQSRGVTVFQVSHDDEYIACSANLILSMENGCLRRVIRRQVQEGETYNA